jgi:hypothetical protein
VEWWESRLGRPRREVVSEDTTSPLPGYLCEACLEAPAIALVPAPWGGEMGLCQACQQHQAAARDEGASASGGH